MGAVPEELLPGGSPCRLSSGRTASVEGTPWGSGAERDPEGAVETKRQGLTLTAAPSPRSPALLAGGEGEVEN